MTHRQLLEQVWGPGHAHQMQYLRVYMTQLRHKLEENPARPRYLSRSPASATGSRPRRRRLSAGSRGRCGRLTSARSSRGASAAPARPAHQHQHRRLLLSSGLSRTSMCVRMARSRACRSPDRAASPTSIGQSSPRWSNPHHTRPRRPASCVELGSRCDEPSPSPSAGMQCPRWQGVGRLLINVRSSWAVPRHRGQGYPTTPPISSLLARCACHG